MQFAFLDLLLKFGLDLAQAPNLSVEFTLHIFPTQGVSFCQLAFQLLLMFAQSQLVFLMLCQLLR